MNLGGGDDPLVARRTVLVGPRIQADDGEILGQAGLLEVQGETKTQRAKAVSYVPQSGRVFTPCERDNDYWRHWYLEMTGFPHRTRDDVVDTAVMAWTFFESGRQFG